MAELSSETIHASCVAIDGVAVLIEGRSGAGKSDLALRLIDRGAKLVSDDYTLLVRHGPRLLAAPPVNLAGRMEVRGIGIVDLPHARDVPVELMISIVDDAPRMPLDEEDRRIAGVKLATIALAALEPSAPIKVEMAVRQRAGAR